MKKNENEKNQLFIESSHNLDFYINKSMFKVKIMTIVCVIIPNMSD